MHKKAIPFEHKYLISSLNKNKSGSQLIKIIIKKHLVHQLKCNIKYNNVIILTFINNIQTKDS